MYINRFYSPYISVLHECRNLYIRVIIFFSGVFISSGSGWDLFSERSCGFIFLSVLCTYSRPLKICPWVLVAWTKVAPLLSLLTVTTCPLRVWSAAALQPHICRTRWMDRCLVCVPPPTLTSLPCLSFLFLLFPQFLSHLGCLATPQNCEGGRSKVL